MKRLLLTLAFLTVATGAYAQTTGTPSSKLVWDQPNVASAAEAQGLAYKYYPDTVTTGTALTGVACVGTPPAVVSCQVPFPAFTPGSHTLTLTAANVAGESLKSTPLAFTFVVVPTAPANLRVQ